VTTDDATFVANGPAPMVEVETPLMEVETPLAKAEPLAVEAEPLAVEAETPLVDAEPLAVDVEPLAVDAERPAVEAEPPAVEDEPPVVEDEPPVVDVEPLAVAAETPAVDVEPLAVEAETPVVEAEIPAVAVETLAVAVEPPAVEAETPAVAVETLAVAVEPPAVEAETPAVEAETPMVEAEPAAVEVGGRVAPDARRQLVQRFEAWVDRMAAGEPPPPGLPRELLDEAAAADGAEPASGDLYTVFAGLTGLTGEVRLQGRAFKQLADVLAPVADLPGQVEQLAASIEESAADEPDDAEATLPSAKGMLEVMLDLYDRLGRGLQNADAALVAPPAVTDTPGWLGRLLGGTPPSTDGGASSAAVRAMRDGYALTLSRITAALHQWDVEPIGRVGEPFDPRRMVAIDVRDPGDKTPGTVLEVNRTGCAVRGTVLTAAQVTVAR
jgi:hypothetical protein